MHDKMTILISFLFLNFRDLAFDHVIFFRSQAWKLNLSLSLNLILSLSLAWLINQTKLKLFGFSTSSSSNTGFRLVTSSSQA